MIFRTLGKTGIKISEISLGTWQLGARWGDEFSAETADNILNKAMDGGINFIDTADVYNDGNSEKAIAKLLQSRKERIYVATKCGRQLNPHTNETYQIDALRNFVEGSLRNLRVECLDLIQLHCPPTEVYYRPEIFELFDKLKVEGKILNMGVSVERIEEALKAIEFENVTTVQIIFNMFRHRPIDLFFKEAKKKNVGILARVPLASGLLAGKFNKSSTFTSGDHRNFNRNGEYFDKGETFSGVDFDTGIEAVEKIKQVFPPDTNLVNAALRWTLMFDEVSCVIPGASSPHQLDSILSTADFNELSDNQMDQIACIYNSMIKPSVHHLW